MIKINKDIHQYLGLIKRSGSLITGQELVLSAVRAQKNILVLIASDMGATSKKKITDKCKFYEIEFYEIGTKEEISEAIGQARSVIAVNNPGFSKGLVRKINE